MIVNDEQVFKDTAGEYKIQRVPGNERHGRVHTSTAMVVILPERRESKIELVERDLTYNFYAAPGAGGQAKNRSQSAVEITHLPTKLTAQSTAFKSQKQNKEAARRLLKARLAEQTTQAAHTKENQARKGQYTIRAKTVSYQNNLVTDHKTGKKTSLKDWMKGNW